MSDLPVVVIGAGPLGLAAAAQLTERGIVPLVLEAGDCPAAAVSQWGQVRLFSGWTELVDPAAARFLARSGWTAPSSGCPTGGMDLRLPGPARAGAGRPGQVRRPGGRGVPPGQRPTGELGPRPAAVRGPRRLGGRHRVPRGRPGGEERARRAVEDGRSITADRVVVLTGFRPDLSFLSEMRLELDPVLQAPVRLAPGIDPNVHSCGSVPPLGEAELRHPELGLYLMGMKSYGRVPTFLAVTGYEQVRSVVAALACDYAAASRVELTLPETGVCGGAGLVDRPEASGVAGGGCCDPTTGERQLVPLGSVSSCR